MAIIETGNKERKRQFLNSIYFRKEVDNDRGVVYADKLYMIYKDLNTNKKYIEVIKEPTMEIQVIKPEAEKDYYQKYVKIEDCITETVKYSDRNLEMCRILDDNGISIEHPSNGKLIGAEEWYYTCIKSKLNRLCNAVHQKGNIFYASDLDIEDYYKGKFIDEYGENITPLTKGYFDIEVDTVAVGWKGFPDEHESPAPINAITYVNDDNKTVYTYLLRNSKNKLVQELEDNLLDFKREIEKEFINYGDYKYRIRLFDKEIDLIRVFLNQVNDDKLDMMGGYVF